MTHKVIGRLKAEQRVSERSGRLALRWVGMVWRMMALVAAQATVVRFLARPVPLGSKRLHGISEVDLLNEDGLPDGVFEVEPEGASQASGSGATLGTEGTSQVPIPGVELEPVVRRARRRRRRRTKVGQRSVATYIDVPVVGVDSAAQTVPRRTGGRQRREKRRRRPKYIMARHSSLNPAAIAFRPSFADHTEGAFLAAAREHGICIGAAAA